MIDAYDDRSDIKSKNISGGIFFVQIMSNSIQIFLWHLKHWHCQKRFIIHKSIHAF